MAGPGFYNEADQKLYEDFQFLPQEQYRLGLGNTTTTKPSNVEQTGIMSQVPSSGTYIPPYQDVGNGGGNGDDDDDSTNTRTGKFGLGDLGNVLGFMVNPIGTIITKGIQAFRNRGRDRDGDPRGPTGLMGEGTGLVDANAGFGPFLDTGAITADGNAMGGGNPGGPTGGANDGTAAQGYGSADDGFKADGGRVGYFFGGKVNYKNRGIGSIL